MWKDVGIKEGASLSALSPSTSWNVSRPVVVRLNIEHERLELQREI